MTGHQANIGWLPGLLALIVICPLTSCEKAPEKQLVPAAQVSRRPSVEPPQVAQEQSKLPGVKKIEAAEPEAKPSPQLVLPESPEGRNAVRKDAMAKMREMIPGPVRPQ